ncbi:unnamed protein product [Merluccius merluccius]
MLGHCTVNIQLGGHPAYQTDRCRMPTPQQSCAQSSLSFQLSMLFNLNHQVESPLRFHNPSPLRQKPTHRNRQLFHVWILFRTETNQV